jgi:hypothetical protein
MRNHILCLLIASSISATLSSQNRHSESAWVATRIVEYTTLKSKPTAVGYDTISVEPKTKIKVLDVTPADALVKIRYDEIIYYVRKDAINLTEDLVEFLENRQVEFNTKIRWINSTFCPVRQRPDSLVKLKGELHRGARVLLHEQTGRWARISDFSNPNFDNVWIPSRNLNIDSIDPISWEDLNKEKYLRTHQSVEGRYRDAIRSSKVIPGMDREMTKVSVGLPETTTTTVDENGHQEEAWFYRKPQLRINFLDSKVISTYGGNLQ